MMFNRSVGFLSLSLAIACCQAAPISLDQVLARRLPSLGHRNWIVVADSAYPLQVSPGVETIVVRDSQIEAVKKVLTALRKTHHVRPVISLDRELAFVSESDAPGITAYRTALKRSLAGQATQTLLHEDIIKKLDEAGKTFHVVLIKTPMTLPYTSVFIQLECGYWTSDAESRLRKAMAK